MGIDLDLDAQLAVGADRGSSQEDEHARFCDGVRALSGVDLASHCPEVVEQLAWAAARREGLRRLSRHLDLLRCQEKELESFRDQGTPRRSALWDDPDDLLRLSLPQARYDLALCRDSAPRLDGSSRRRLDARLAEALRPSGFLVVASGERLPGDDCPDLARVWPSVYHET